jgi:hypothetical protein
MHACLYTDSFTHVSPPQECLVQVNGLFREFCMHRLMIEYMRVLYESQVLLCDTLWCSALLNCVRVL